MALATWQRLHMNPGGENDNEDKQNNDYEDKQNDDNCSSSQNKTPDGDNKPQAEVGEEEKNKENKKDE